MNASAIIVTRGDVDLVPVCNSIPSDWEIVIWNNGNRDVSVIQGGNGGVKAIDVPDLSVYGRYAAIEHASHDLIYVQDDDVIVSDPQAIVNCWDRENFEHEEHATPRPFTGIVANMPQEFRHDGYTDSCLVGFGACFHRDLPERAFKRWWSDYYHNDAIDPVSGERGFFYRTCDVWFTTLTPRVLVDVPRIDREFASDDDRMWKQPSHYGERVRMLELARMVRDA